MVASMIEAIHSFLVHPAKHLEQQPEISGTDIPLEGSLFDMLMGVFDRSQSECEIEIVFRPDNKGQQQNPCHVDIVQYEGDPGLDTGRPVASRLQSVTTNRSGLGLLFLIKGTAGGDRVVVIARFPADQGVVAQEDASRLSVEFVERVFMRSSKAYKSVLYRSTSPGRGFWEGRAVDRQISGPREVSDYWIRDFLLSELRTTGPAGTKRLAIALREAIRKTSNTDVKHELVSAATLMRGRGGKTQSARRLVEQIGLSELAAAELESAFAREDLMDEVFPFDQQEFDKHIVYRAVGLDNGALLIARDESFAEVFHEELLGDTGDGIRYTTEGIVVEESLRKSR